MRLLRAAAVAAAATALVGCGKSGGGGGALPDGASIAPASAPAFISVNTDFTSAQWEHVPELAAKFPLTKQLLRQFRTETGLELAADVKPALGPEVDIVWLDFANDGNNVVVLTQPRDEQKLDALLKKAQEDGGTTAKAKVGDWTVIAENRARIDRFKQMASDRKLDSNDEFKDAMSVLDGDSLARAWVDGQMVQTPLDQALEGGGAAPRITREIGTLRSISASATAESDGLSIDASGFIDPNPDPATFSPSLPDDMPSGALLYVSAAGLDDATRLILKMVARSNPRFETQLKQVEGVFGLTLEDDIYPLIRGESGLAVYRGGRIPPILFLQKVRDEKKADALVRRFSALAQIGGEVGVDTAEIAGVTVQKLTFPGAVTIWDAAANGKIMVTNSERLARQALAGPDTSLADEDLYKAAREAAGLPDKVTAFAYGDLEHGLPFVFDLAEQSGEAIPPEARTNTKALHASMLYLRRDGDRLRLSGFATIK